jgi:hypothetical protein
MPTNAEIAGKQRLPWARWKTFADFKRVAERLALTPECFTAIYRA